MTEDTVLVQCRFDLTDSEVAAAARKRAAIETEIAKVDSAFDVQKEKHKKALGTLEGQAGALGDLIRKGYELRDAECTIQFDYEGGQVNTVRADTGEIVKTRPMTDNEKSKGLPLPLGPAILLSESDPDIPAGKPAESNTDAPPTAPKKKDCDNCHHLRTYHLDEDGKDCFCWQPDCDCEAFVTFSTAAPKRRRAHPNDVCLCGDLRSDHRSATGCDACDCSEFRDSDPLGVADVHAKPEKQEAEL
jgi:hypothetical protein